MPAQIMGQAALPINIGAAEIVEINNAILQLMLIIPANYQTVSPLVPTIGYKRIAFAVQSSKDGAISLQRYLDTAGLITQGEAIEQALVAGAITNVNVLDDKAFQSLRITVTNSTDDVATLSNILLLLQSH